jgi:hypothetical protein
MVRFPSHWLHAPPLRIAISSGRKTLEGIMGNVMIECPETGLAVPTGLRADRKDFERSTVFFSRSYCPHCDRDHEWFAGDAWVEDNERRVPRYEAVAVAAE